MTGRERQDWREIKGGRCRRPSFPPVRPLPPAANSRPPQINKKDRFGSTDLHTYSKHTRFTPFDMNHVCTGTLYMHIRNVYGPPTQKLILYY